MNVKTVKSFLKILKNDGIVLVLKKWNALKGKAFMLKLILKEREYFADQRDKRREFESEMQQKSKDFYAELREQQREFNEEWRVYNKRWQDWQKEKKDKRKKRRQQGYSNSRGGLSPEEARDFQQMQNAQGSKLSTDDN